MNRNNKSIDRQRLMMVRLICKNILVCAALLVLSACGGSSGGGGTSAQIPGESGPSESPVLSLGKSNFDATCSVCHGSNGDNEFTPIIVDACEVADCSNIEALASYIDTFMPIAMPQSCTLDGENSCAFTTASYILNGFSTETVGDPTEESTEPSGPIEPTEQPDQNVQTPLARLTNDEYTNSVRTLLGLPGDSPQINAAKASLASESSVGGLTNDAVTQTLTQLALSGYSTMAFAASNDFLQGITSKAGLEQLLGCPALIENIETTAPTRACVEEFSKNLISKAYRRASTENDSANVERVYDNIIALNGEFNNSLFDITAHRDTLQALIQLVMLSPEFLLVVESGETDVDNSNAPVKSLTDHEVATRLALFLAGSLPDDELLADANAGLLGDTAVRLRHADRLMNSDIGITQFTSLINSWLSIDSSLTNPADLNALSTFITDWFVNEGLFSDLYQGPVTVEHVNGTETTERLGVLGLQSFVASHTNFPTPSFITRGVFVVERLLCSALPEDLPDGALDVGELTPVEVFEGHAKQPCATCHRVFDNYGAAFQRFDAETSLYNPSFQDFGSSFDLYDIGDVTASVTGLDDLAFTMASSERASSCMVELWYRHSMRRDIDKQGKDDFELQSLVGSWSESGDKNMKALLRSIVASDSFVTLYTQ